MQQGDLYIHTAQPGEDIWGCVHEALQRGAAAIIASEAFEAEEDLEVPVMLLPDCLDAQQRLAIAFYDNPSTKMTVVGVTGKLLQRVKGKGPFLGVPCARQPACAPYLLCRPLPCIFTAAAMWSILMAQSLQAAVGRPPHPG